MGTLGHVYVIPQYIPGFRCRRYLHRTRFGGMHRLDGNRGGGKCSHYDKRLVGHFVDMIFDGTPFGGNIPGRRWEHWFPQKG